MLPNFPIHYVEPVFRPPSEAQSLILPVTDGCSWNQCTFCEMYTAPQKAFRARDESEVLDSIRRTGEQYAGEIPVSYTHLDVYKRQVLYTASGAALRGMKVIVPVDGMSADNAYTCLLYTSRCV